MAITRGVLRHVHHNVKTGGQLDEKSVANIASVNMGIPLVIRCTVTGASPLVIYASNCPRKILIIDFFIHLTAAGASSDTVTLDDGTTAITDAIDCNDLDKVVSRCTTIDDAKSTIALNGSLRIANVGAPDGIATIVCIPIA